MSITQTPGSSFPGPVDVVVERGTNDDPLSWPVSRKWVVTAALSATSLNRILVSTTMAPALPTTIGHDLNLTSLQTTAALSAFVLATAF